MNHNTLTHKYLTKSNFIFSCSAPTNRQERAMKKRSSAKVTLYL